MELDPAYTRVRSLLKHKKYFLENTPRIASDLHSRPKASNAAPVVVSEIRPGSEHPISTNVSAGERTRRRYETKELSGGGETVVVEPGVSAPRKRNKEAPSDNAMQRTWRTQLVQDRDMNGDDSYDMLST